MRRRLALSDINTLYVEMYICKYICTYNEQYAKINFISYLTFINFYREKFLNHNLVICWNVTEQSS